MSGDFEVAKGALSREWALWRDEEHQGCRPTTNPWSNPLGGGEVVCEGTSVPDLGRRRRRSSWTKTGDGPAG